MNKKMVLYTVGKIILTEAGLFVLPTVCAVLYSEKTAKYFLISMVIALLTGALLCLFGKTDNKTIFAREGFATVALAWVLMSAIGALPFYLSKEIPRYTDAFFETVSGFTTTGASILKDVESMSHGMLFWRSFTHWIGGMGVLVLVMAIFPSNSGRSIHIMKAEMPGPIIGKLMPKVRSTAVILYYIYIVLSVLQIVLLLFGRMPLFDSIVYTFGTAGTGGFGIKADSVGSYSPYIQWVIAIFMMIFGVNFNIYYLILIKKLRQAIKSEELWVYTGIVFVSTALITANLYSAGKAMVNFSSTVRTSFFQVLSIISTTGYATVNFDNWPVFSKTVLLVLMFFGACAGSTAGGLKISRVILLLKTAKSNLKHLIHPRSVKTIKFEGKKVDEDNLSNLNAYLISYFTCLIVILLIVSIDRFDMETNISAVVSCFNNVGPGFAAVGPIKCYAEYSDLSKIVLSAAMLLGRLEIYPVLLLFSPDLWIKNKNRRIINKG